jgi:imidazolonepropionase-like amidohydrolase
MSGEIQVVGGRKSPLARKVAFGQTRMSAPPIWAATLFVLVLAWNVRAAEQIPGKPQEGPVLLSGADVYTVSGEVIRGGQVLMDGGKVVRVGKDLEAPPGAKRIELAGKRVYPGLIATGNDLGLAEVRSVRGMIDTSEAGDINPNARAEVAVNPDSELIPVARANGVLLNLTMPSGGMLPGTSAVLQLDGWTWEEMTVRAPAAVHVTWPRGARTGRRGGGGGGGEEAGPTRREDQLRALDQAFADARAYLSAKRAATRPSGEGGATRPLDHDARWEAMIPLLEGRVPLVVAAEELGQIQAAVAFAAREKVRLVIFGGYDAPLCADLLKAHDVPVVVNGIHRLPLRADAPYDEPFTVPERLRQAGVRYCITLAHRFGGSDVRNLPYHAATAAAYGLPAEEALKAITLYPAQILGVADRVGSIEAGRDATLIVTDGDILETATHVEQAFVQGRAVDLSSKHTGLWQKYQEKYRRRATTRALSGG